MLVCLVAATLLTTGWVVARALVTSSPEGSHPTQVPAATPTTTGSATPAGAPSRGAPSDLTVERAHPSPITSAGPLHPGPETYSSSVAWWACGQRYAMIGMGLVAVTPTELSRGLPLSLAGGGSSTDKEFLLLFTEQCERGADLAFVPQDAGSVEWTAFSDDHRTVAAVVRIEEWRFHALRVTEPDGSVLTLRLVH